MSENYIFERISQQKLKDIKLLYKDCFNEDVSLDFLNKKYSTAVFGTDNIGFIAYDIHGDPAAYYGVFPCNVIIGANTYLCAQSGDTMTHPKHRGKGLFIKLAKMTYELAIMNGIKFVFGFPNENSYPGFVNKLKWVHKENLNIYKIKIFTFPIAYICNKVSILSKLYQGYAHWIIKNKLSKRSFFDNPLVSQKNDGVLRNEEFFVYKNYIKKEIIEINRKGIYIKIASALRIGDIESVNKEDFYIILKKLKHLARLLGCYALTFYYSPDTEYDKFLSGKFTSEKGLPIGWVDLGSGLNLETLKFSQADLDTY